MKVLFLDQSGDHERLKDTGFCLEFYALGMDLLC